MVAPFDFGRIPAEPSLKISNRVQHGSTLAAADANARNNPVFG
jgi:hypothetical protein